jgi:hypothetical protein
MSLVGQQYHLHAVLKDEDKFNWAELALYRTCRRRYLTLNKYFHAKIVQLRFDIPMFVRLSLEDSATSFRYSYAFFVACHLGLTQSLKQFRLPKDIPHGLQQEFLVIIQVGRPLVRMKKYLALPSHLVNQLIPIDIIILECISAQCLPFVKVFVVFNEGIVGG